MELEIPRNSTKSVREVLDGFLGKLFAEDAGEFSGDSRNFFIEFVVPNFYMTTKIPAIWL